MELYLVVLVVAVVAATALSFALRSLAGRRTARMFPRDEADLALMMEAQRLPSLSNHDPERED